MTQNYEWWLSTLGETGSLDDLKGARIGIDAAHYLRTRVIRNPGPPNPFEPLTPAHGGLPLRLRDQVESDLYQFRQRQIKPVFVFPGIDVDRHVDPFQVRREGEVALSAAWSIYERGDPDNSVTKFGESSYPQPEDAFRALQSHLRSFDADFFVAPYSSEAQLQCFLQENIVQAVAGPLELLLFACDRVIAYWDFTTAIHQTGTFRFISRSRCMGELKKVSQNGSLSDDQFIDALLLAGTHFFPTPFPPLDAGPRIPANQAMQWYKVTARMPR
ncbi:PIN domain-like protein [Sporormia fimetaria CBS 119925]|uniref:PIN domain-like protein n=1 Tax=Sporormia fimetaria CBS 119925 TaxID=1340428 RepID=A0A6A6V346_9PLEO|nr:PIN domain-like protein [Sporormia fimetaria CBS 119925]